MFNKVFLRNIPFFVWAACTLACLLGLIDPAWAQAGPGSPAAGGSATTLGAIFCNMYVNAEPFGKEFSWVAYVSGACCVLQAIYHFKGHTESPQNHPLNRPVILWAGAMCLLALPSAVVTLVSGLYTVSGVGSPSGCNQPGSTAGASGGLDVMMTNFVANIKPPLLSFISLTAALCGLYMIVHGLMKASKYGFDPKTHSINSILSNIVVGALLMTIGDNLNMMMGSVFGAGTTMGSATSVVSWTLPSGTSVQFTNGITAALTFVQLIGAIAFVRGWLVMKKVADGGGNVTMAQGITHIIGGVLAINIGGFLKIMDTTFGTGLIG